MHTNSVHENVRPTMPVQGVKKVFSRSGTIAITTVAASNAIFYYPLAIAGGNSIKKLFQTESSALDMAVIILAAWACVCYGLFMYRTLELFEYRKARLLEGAAIVVIAPLASLAFFGGGIEGCEQIPFLNQPGTVIACGVILFIFRQLNMIDGIYKFKARTVLMKNELANANCLDFIRIAIPVLASVGYALSTTDSIFFSLKKMVELNNGRLTGGLEGLFYFISVVGAIGIFPLALFWTHKGVKQLTCGGKRDAQGQTADLTDKYTFLGLLLTLPVFLGILGSATEAQGDVWGKTGLTGLIIRIASALIYAACAGTVPWAALLRGNMASGLHCCRPSVPVPTLEARPREILTIEPGLMMSERNPGKDGSNPDLPLLANSPAEQRQKVVPEDSSQSLTIMTIMQYRHADNLNARGQLPQGSLKDFRTLSIVNDDKSLGLDL